MHKNSIIFVKPVDVTKDKLCGNARRKSIILSSEKKKKSLHIVRK